VASRFIGTNAARRVTLFSARARMAATCSSFAAASATVVVSLGTFGAGRLFSLPAEFFAVSSIARGSFR
jgi:hypothetical protein